MSEQMSNLHLIEWIEKRAKKRKEVAVKNEKPIGFDIDCMEQDFNALFEALRKADAQLSSHLSIAEIAAQRCMEPQEVVHELVPDKNGITCYATKDRLCYILNEETNCVIRIPYTAITPALIKAVCGGE